MKQIKVPYPPPAATPSLQHLRHRRQDRQQTSQHQAARQSTRARSRPLRRTRRRATGSRRHGAVAAAAAGSRRHGGSRSRGRGSVSTRARAAGALLVLVDDKVDNVVAVALNVQVVDGRVGAGVAVDVARVAVRDDAAGVRLADLDAGRAPVEELPSR